MSSGDARRAGLREKKKATKKKLRAVKLLTDTRTRRASTAENAPVVLRSRLVRAAAVGQIGEINRLLGKGKNECVVDEFEVKITSFFQHIVLCVLTLQYLYSYSVAGQWSECAPCQREDGAHKVRGSVAEEEGTPERASPGRHDPRFVCNLAHVQK